MSRFLLTNGPNDVLLEDFQRSNSQGLDRLFFAGPKMSGSDLEHADQLSQAPRLLLKAVSRSR